MISGKFTRPTVNVLVAAKRAGKSDAAAAREAGISRPLIYDWLRKGDAGLDGYATFAREFRAAEKAHHAEWLASINGTTLAAAS